MDTAERIGFECARKREEGGRRTIGPPGVDRACSADERRVADSTDNWGMAGGGWPRHDAASNISMRDKDSSRCDSFRADSMTCSMNHKLTLLQANEKKVTEGEQMAPTSTTASLDAPTDQVVANRFWKEQQG